MKLVLDNNILFSLMNPFSTASYIFFFLSPENVFAPEFIKSEFERYKELCLFKSKLSEHEFELRFEELKEKIKFIELSEYNKFIEQSAGTLPDPDDADFLALALSINASIWSNDPHLREQSFIKTLTTSELLIKLLNNEI